jgi:hypothetical protein
MSDPSKSHEPSAPQEPPEVTITTQPFELTPKEYLRILLRVMDRKYWWLSSLYSMMIFSLLFLMYLSTGHFGFEADLEMSKTLFKWLIILCLFVVSYVIYYYFYLRSFAHHPSNRVIMLPRTITFDKKQIIARASSEGPDDTVESVWVYKNEDVFQVANLNWCYLFFVTHAMFVFIPKNAFQNSEDREYFEKEILPLYPPRKLKFWQGVISWMAILFIGIVCSILLVCLFGV